MNRPSPPPSDRLIRLQIMVAFLVPVTLLAYWLWSKGFFSSN